MTSQDLPLLASNGTASFKVNGCTEHNGHSNGVNTQDGGGKGGEGGGGEEGGVLTDSVGKTAGNEADVTPLRDGSNLDKREFIRIALQAFQDMGYMGTVEALAKESRVSLESATVKNFRQGVLNGDWLTAERLLFELPEEHVLDSKCIIFLIRQQKFLESLEASETKKALSILRNELAPLDHDSDRLHILSSLMMCSSSEELRARAAWDGVEGQSRTQLLVNIQLYISPSLLLPQRRLETLLEQAQQYQRVNCLFHAVDVRISLLSDCKCDSNFFPSVTVNILRDHTDEIWRLQFSHNGDWLATAGRDKTICVWNVKTGFSLDKILREHSDFIFCLAWSPDDLILLTAAESTIKMWDTTTGKCTATLSQHQYAIGALSWLHDGKGFISGGMDSKVFLWDLDGNVTSMLSNLPSRVIDLVVTPDGKRLITVGLADITAASSVIGSRSETPAPTPPSMKRHEKRFSVYNLSERKIEFEITQPGELTSVSVSRDSRFAIVSHAPNEILYIDLQNGTIVRRFQGHDQGKYILQSCFGGALENYVMSGSEDGQVYVWHRDTGALIAVLKGHGPGSVNAVAWNPKHPAMFASASDDRTVRIWGLPGAENDRSKALLETSARSFDTSTMPF